MKQLIGHDVGSYSFSPSTNQITISGVTLSDEQFLIITNTNPNTMIYNFADPTLAGSWSAGVMTLQYNCSGMNAGDPLQIYVDLPGVVNSVAISGTPSVAISTMPSLNDNQLMAAQTQDSPIFTAITGDPNGDFAGINILEQVATDQSGLGLNVKIISGMGKTDQSGGIILSDAPVPIYLSGAVGEIFLIDTTGYESLSLTTANGFAGSVTAGDDINYPFQALTGCPRVLGALTSSVAANSGYSFPCLARWIMITLTAAGNAVALLRMQTWSGSYTTSVPTATASNNVAQFGGTNIVTGGVAGIPSVGGNIAAGTAATANPVPVGGVDSSNLTRRILTDASGKAQVSVISSFPPQNPFSVNSNPVQDVGGTDGNNHYELLYQMLLELRILNQQVYNLMGVQGADTPDAYRADLSFITI